MKKYVSILTLCAGLSSAFLFAAGAQEHKHEQHQDEKSEPVKKSSEPAKAGAMKCCEGMEKMGDMKAGVPMKGEMTEEMKAKMEKMKAMKQKMTEKMSEKGVKSQPQDSTIEKTPSSKDAHQH